MEPFDREADTPHQIDSIWSDSALASALQTGKIEHKFCARISAMDDEGDIARPKDWQPKNLEFLSIEQLEEYVAELEGEIVRAKTDIAAKKAHLSGA